MKLHPYIKPLTISLLLLLLASLTTGCTKDSGDGGSNGDDGVPKETCSLIGLEPKIINGTTCIQGRAGVVSIAIRGPQDASLCTGTMVTKSVVLTAAHCFQEIEAAIANGEATAEDFTIEVTGGPVGAGSQRTTASEITTHPDFDLAVDQTLQNDIAYITLSEPLDLDTLPVLVSRQVQIGDKLAIYGFGLDEDQRTGIPKSGTMTVEDLSQDNIFADFDNSSSNTCTGDSGGPAIIRAKNASGQTITGLVGVTSTGSATGAQSCSKGERSSFTNLASPQVVNWLRANISGIRIE